MSLNSKLKVSLDLYNELGQIIPKVQSREGVTQLYMFKPLLDLEPTESNAILIAIIKVRQFLESLE